MSRLRSVWLVARREILERGRSRAYIGSLLITIVFLVAGFGLPTLLAGDQSTRLGIVGEAPPQLEGTIRRVATAFDEDAVVEFTPFVDRAAAEAALADESIDAALAVPPDLSTPGELIVQEEADDTVRSIVTQAIVALRAGEAIAPPTVTALDPRSDADRAAFLLANVGIILTFIGIFSYGFWVLGGVIEEKQSRVVEVVLSTVRPRDLLMGKVLGIGILGMGQLVFLVAAGLIVAQVTGRFELPPTTAGSVVALLLWFTLGYALYSTVLGFLAALTSRMEEASNVTTPVTMVAMLSYFAAIFLVTDDPDGPLAVILSFIPPTAPMVVPLRAALGAISPIELVGSVLVTLVAIYILFVIGGRVYSGAVLSTGSRMKLRDAWRASR